MNEPAHHELHHLGKDSFVTILSLSVLLISLFTIVIFIGNRQTVERKAAGTVVLSMIPVSPAIEPISISPGETVTIDVQVNTNGQHLSAADLNINIPSQFELVTNSNAVPNGFAPRGFLQATNAVQSNGNGGFTRSTISAIDINDAASTKIPYFNGGIARLVVGAVCDECYLGAAGGGYPNCNSIGSPDAQCYPATGNGPLARLVLRAKTTAASGTYNLTFAGSTKAAATEVSGTADDNVISSMNGLAVTITGTSTGGCSNFDVVAPSGSVDTADIQNIIIDYWGTSVGDAGYNSVFDVVAPSGSVDTADIQNIILDYWGATCS